MTRPNFLTSIKKSNPSEQNFIDNMQSEIIPYIDQLYNASQVLENSMCQFPECFLGINDSILSCVRVLDSDVSVPDKFGSVISLKQGDLIISFDEISGQAGYLIKSGIQSNRYKERYVSYSDYPNFKIVGFADDLANQDWIFISDNFFSALAIHNATGVTTLAIPENSMDEAFAKTLSKIFDGKKIICFFNASEASANTGLVQSLKNNSVYSAFIDLDYISTWVEYRECYFVQYLDHDEAIQEFKKMLRSQIRNVFRVE